MCYFLLKLSHEAIKTKPGRPNAKCLGVLLALPSCNFAVIISLRGGSSSFLLSQSPAWLWALDVVGPGLPRGVGLVVTLGRAKEQDCFHPYLSVPQLFTNAITPCPSKLEYYLSLPLRKLRHGAVIANCFKHHSESFSKPVKGKEEML